MSDADLLHAAARQAVRAPSVLNTQPWRWRVTAGHLELRADPGRSLTATDPEHRLQMLSCGAALHHARVALAAAGRSARVDRMPDPREPDLLARLALGEAVAADPGTVAMADAIARRRTDRRAYGARRLPDALLDRLAEVVEAEGAHLHRVRWAQTPMLAVSTARAAAAERDDAEYLRELERWTHRPPEAGDGVPAATAVRPAPRRVPVRDHVPGETAGLTAGASFDEGATFVVLYGGGDAPEDWLRGGEAASALLLTATAEGVATAPLSDVVEVAAPRQLLRTLLGRPGEPYLVVRLGYVDDTAPPLPPAPRRDPDEVIERLP
ncbi:Acg family FMN-binding oxidoreductase [Spirilliplanes yamanashiensis]|uniref:Putative NAD(P)H nitroreductase n=1 Tax=Spirilliplanes yamanashiensis TaxID=42233 RepID=A0A8J3YFK3_9ACTN|nr:nitroreductase family protein [Spirilliplanes yamanashiensis]MDP9818215.1 nitroreductase [Spirilliplanes yamanashiensis]GIJ06758.1 putative NAD(P)H nitroreductase [Spirilliplanes yamanashiensis]